MGYYLARKEGWVRGEWERDGGGIEKKRRSDRERERRRQKEVLKK